MKKGYINFREFNYLSNDVSNFKIGWTTDWVKSGQSWHFWKLLGVWRKDYTNFREYNTFLMTYPNLRLVDQLTE